MLQRTGLPSLVSARSPLAARVPAWVRTQPSMRILRGRSTVLEAQPLLAKLARRSGQSGDAESLPYFLSTDDALKKLPCLLMAEGPGELEGAVLIFEYRTSVGGTRVYSTADMTGRRTVIAAPECRARMAASASRTLIEDGAQVVHIAFSETHSSDEAEGGARLGAPAMGHAREAIARELGRGQTRPTEWLFAEGEMPLYLPLHETFDKTLARIGQRTRSNLRYYRRRSEVDLGSRFVADASVRLEDFLAFNGECTYAVSEELAAWRYETLQSIPNTRLSGVVDRHGRWLSLVGVRGSGSFVEIDWQMNRADLPAYSLSTVMRSYLIGHEIGRGTTRLYIEGGTPQPIGRSFLKERVAELTVIRRSPYVAALQRFALRIFPAKNRLAQILADPEACWTAR